MSNRFLFNEGESFVQNISTVISQSIAELNASGQDNTLMSSENNAEDEPFIFNEVQRFFKVNQWNFNVIENRTALYFTYQGNQGKWVTLFVTQEPLKRLAVYSIYPEKVPEYKRLEIAQLITHFNYNLFLGNFEMNFADGELRYRVSLDVKNSPITFPLFQQLLATNTKMMDHYFLSLRGVMLGEISLENALFPS